MKPLFRANVVTYCYMYSVAIGSFQTTAQFNMPKYCILKIRTVYFHFEQLDRKYA